MTFLVKYYNDIHYFYLNHVFILKYQWCFISQISIAFYKKCLFNIKSLVFIWLQITHLITFEPKEFNYVSNKFFLLDIKLNISIQFANIYVFIAFETSYFNKILIFVLEMEFQINYFNIIFIFLFFTQFQYFFIHRTVLNTAVEKEDVDIVKILVAAQNINPNSMNIYICVFTKFMLIIFWYSKN